MNGGRPRQREAARGGVALVAEDSDRAGKDLHIGLRGTFRSPPEAPDLVDAVCANSLGIVRESIHAARLTCSGAAR